MAQDEGADKTEKPTPKRLDDARKKGDVAKSRELTSTAGLILWLALAATISSYAAVRLGVLCEVAFETIARGWTQTGFNGAMRTVGIGALESAVLLTTVLLVPAAAIETLADFLQVGPILAFDKVTPKMENMNPAAGVKRMFSMDNLIEVFKALAKTMLLIAIGWLIVRSALPEIIMLARSADTPGQAISTLIWSLTLKLLGWTIALFTLVSLLDASYQRWSFTKKMRMSMHDIREESKESEGNPQVKGQRRQAAQEWSQGGAAQSARDANVLIVNPTHFAIAIDYDEQNAPVPTIACKGEGEDAREMRQAAEQAGTPIVRNIPLARDLFARGEIGEIIPSDLFDIIAEVILWAQEAREQADLDRAAERNPAQARAAPTRRVKPPGDDLTHYTRRSSY